MASDEPSGFSFETFDATAARISQSHIASRLTAGPKDESGRFRVTKGMSTLAAPEDDASKKPTGVRLLDPTKAISCNVVKRFAEEAPRGGAGGGGGSSRGAKRAKKRSVDEDGGGQEEEDVDKKNKTWISTGLVVKILARSLRDAGHYKKKGIVRRVLLDRGTRTRPGAEVEVIGPSEATATATEDPTTTTTTTTPIVVEVDARDLETVLPATGKPVRVVKGEHAGSVGELRAIHEGRFLAEVALDTGDGVRQRIEFLQYDEVCKVNR